ncbi:MAG: thioesterase family protein [Prevotellaceae bacterium]|jgi:predicted thioesterase|nr:thioesterase family protein [Prevotellaceae bacterium]
MELTLKEGLQHVAEKVVTPEDTASQYGSGLVEVFATPAMVGLMENAAMSAVSPHLPQGYGTVGTAVCVTHVKATPVGMKVWGVATLVRVEGRRLQFEVAARDEQGEIGRGTHERCVVDIAKFTSKVAGGV